MQVPHMRSNVAHTLTPKMHMVWIALCKYYEANGYGPSYQELADMIGARSKSEIWRLVTSLHDRAILTKPYRTPRDYVIHKWPKELGNADRDQTGADEDVAPSR